MLSPISQIESGTKAAIQRLKDNEIATNPLKFELMFLSKYKDIENNMFSNGNTIASSDTVELLGINIEQNINFKRHIQNICDKAINKTKALF